MINNLIIAKIFDLKNMFDTLLNYNLALKLVKHLLIAFEILVFDRNFNESNKLL